MQEPSLDIAFWNYDRTKPLAEGAVRIAGAEARFHTAKIVTEIFKRMIRDRAYDVSELGMTYFLRTFRGGESPLVAIPVFPNRAFRHSAVYINKASRIEHQLAGEPRITVPMIALAGEDDGVDPSAPWDKVAPHFTDLRRQSTLPGVGHNLPQEARRRSPEPCWRSATDDGLRSSRRQQRARVRGLRDQVR